MSAPRERSVGDMLREADPRGRREFREVLLNPEQADAIARVLDAADALRASPSDDWRDAYGSPDAALGVVMLTPKHYAERAYDAARRDLLRALEGGE